MCGRYLIEEREIFPGSRAPVFVARDGLQKKELTWGIPMKSGLLINARGETVTEKPTFRSAFQRGRCLVPAAEFYEWNQGVKYAFFQSGGPLYLAGIERETERGRRFVILTREAEGVVAKYHHRMPVIVPEAQAKTYLKELDYALFLASGGQRTEGLKAERRSEG